MSLNTKRRPIVVGATLALLMSALVATPAAATNECLAQASMNVTYDHASTYQPAGTCKYHKIQGEWFQPGSGGGYYYLSATKSNVGVGGTLYVGYTLDTAYEISRYRACTDTASTSCSYGSWRSNTSGQVFP